MDDKPHLSTQFDAEINAVSTRVLEMGGQVESQLAQAIYSLRHLDVEAARTVLQVEKRVNQMEVDIDADITQIIAKRQPTARDLRVESGTPMTIGISDLQHASDLAIEQMRKSLDAFARLDEKAAVDIVESDFRIDEEFDGFTRKVITYVMEDPRAISTMLDLMFVAKAIERIGDHAKNIAELVIYIVRGTDVRHNKEAFREVAGSLGSAL
ncbi:MAG: phosphate transport system regulator PhoU [Thiomonas sp. 14-64-326]|nr:MAG: phosphate transport system regulator PhoU [Thiomonas sp. 14-64-326]